MGFAKPCHAARYYPYRSNSCKQASPARRRLASSGRDDISVQFDPDHSAASRESSYNLCALSSSSKSGYGIWPSKAVQVEIRLAQLNLPLINWITDIQVLAGVPRFVDQCAEAESIPRACKILGEITQPVIELDHPWRTGSLD